MNSNNGAECFTPSPSVHSIVLANFNNDNAAVESPTNLFPSSLIASTKAFNESPALIPGW
ncbi:Uncharacterised protein, partial [Mycoplasmopsis edwardii]